MTIQVAGASGQSPLARLISTELERLGDVTFDDVPPAVPVYWRRLAAGTALQWFGQTRSQPPEVAYDTADVLIDLHGDGLATASRVWRIVDKCGTPLLSPKTALTGCGSEAYVASLFLIESTDGGENWDCLSAAHISSVSDRRALLEKLGRTAVQLISDGIRRDHHPRKRWVASKRPLAELLRMRLANASARWRNRLTDETWAIGVLDEPPERLIASHRVSPTNWIRSPRANAYIADPFAWDGRKDVILCELYPFDTRRGTLEALELHQGRVVRTSPVTPDLDCHFSYPFNWSENGRTYCMPEMGESRRQILYELIPGQPLQFVSVIAEDVSMADPTLFRANGLYWLAYSDGDIGLFDNLCLRFAERLEGPWRPHPLNPVKMDVRSSRPGGTPFWVEDVLFRPAQNCARTYGGALAINRVDVCTPDDYREEPVAMLSPDPGGPFPDGLHTLSVQNDTVLIDGKSLPLSSIPRKVQTKVLKLLGRSGTPGAHTP